MLLELKYLSLNKYTLKNVIITRIIDWNFRRSWRRGMKIFKDWKSKSHSMRSFIEITITNKVDLILNKTNKQNGWAIFGQEIQANLELMQINQFITLRVVSQVNL